MESSIPPRLGFRGWRNKLNVKHTQGPWSNGFQPSTGFGCGYGQSQIIDSKGRPLAGVALVEPENGPMYRNDEFSQESFDLLEANARLIAAAPELLEQLLLAVRCGERDGLPGSPGSAPLWTVSARAVIAKALGNV